MKRNGRQYVPVIIPVAGEIEGTPGMPAMFEEFDEPGVVVDVDMFDPVGAAMRADDGELAILSVEEAGAVPEALVLDDTTAKILWHDLPDVAADPGQACELRRFFTRGQP